MRNFTISIIFCFFCFCSDNIEVKTIESDKGSVRYPHWVELFSLKTKDDLVIGDVFAERINDSIFTNLAVIRGKDTIYRIDSTLFSNTRGKDIQAGKEGFYGYKIVLVKADYFIVNCLTNLGANVSDDVTIEWNYQQDLLEVQKAP